MADDSTTGVLEATHHTIILAFDLVDSEVEVLPGQALKAITSTEVQESIKKTLQQFAASKAKSGTTVVSPDETKKLLEALQGGITDAATQKLLDDIKKTPQFKNLEESLKSFEKAVKASNFGMWVDRNKMVLYIVGAALVVGGGTTLYITKTGGPIIQTPIDQLKGKSFEVLQIGTFKLKAELWEFKPDARLMGAKIEMVKDWKRVSVDLKFGILAEGAKVQEVQGEAIVKSGPIKFTASADVKPYDQKINLGLKMNYDKSFGMDKFSLSLGAIYQDQNTKGTLGAQYQFNKGPTIGLDGNIGVDSGKPAFGGMLTFSIPIKGL